MYRDKSSQETSNSSYSASPSQLNSSDRTAGHGDRAISRSWNPQEYYASVPTHSISHTTSLLTVALSSSSCGSLTSSSSSSSYSLSTLDSDIELGHFINDNCPHLLTSPDDTLYRSPNTSASITSPNARYHLKPGSLLDWDAVKARAKRSIQHYIKSTPQVTLWECIVYAIFGFYLWILLCTFAGDTRVVKTCPLLPNLVVNPAVVANTPPLNAAVLEDVSTLAHSSAILEEQAAHMEYGAREHVLPPTSYPHVV